MPTYVSSSLHTKSSLAKAKFLEYLPLTFCITSKEINQNFPRWEILGNKNSIYNSQWMNQILRGCQAIEDAIYSSFIYHRVLLKAQNMSPLNHFPLGSTSQFKHDFLCNPLSAHVSYSCSSILQKMHSFVTFLKPLSLKAKMVILSNSFIFGLHYYCLILLLCKMTQ